MLFKAGVPISAAVVAVGLAAWGYARFAAHPRFAPETRPEAAPKQHDAPPALTPVLVTSPLAGSVSEVYVTVNTYVTTGNALALIDSPLLRSRLDAAKADLEMERSAEVNAETAAENLQTQLSDALSGKPDAGLQAPGAGANQLYKEEILDDAPQLREALSGKVQQAKAEVQRCEQAVVNAEAAFEQRWVLAPVHGKVTAVNIRTGQAVGPATRTAVLFEIVPMEAK